MLIRGTVRSADGNEPIADAEVLLRVGTVTLAKLYTDKTGRFTHQDTSEEFVGQHLICTVDRDGFVPHQIEQKIDSPEIELDIELERPARAEPPPPPPPPAPPWWKRFIVPASIALAVLIFAGIGYAVWMNRGCSSAADCQAGQYCSDGDCAPLPVAGQACAQSAPPCAEGLACIARDGTCRKLPLAKSEPCDEQSQCSDGLLCDAKAGCTGLPGNGQPCDEGRCADGSVCVSRDATCRTLPLAGGLACDTTEQCAPDHYCAGGSCSRRPAEGQPCPDAVCAEGLKCRADGVCRELPGEGQRCEDGGCGPGLTCIEKTTLCQRTPLAMGQACDKDEHCQDTGFCNRGRCAALPVEGQPCAGQDRRCASGLACAQDDRKCHVPGGRCTTKRPGECAAGTYRLSGDQLSCESTASEQPEVCDGKDNDCNGRVDDNLRLSSCTATTAKGICRSGRQACRNGKLECQPGTRKAKEICDNDQDDDCDGATDEVCIQVTKARIGCLDIQTTGNLTGLVAKECNGKSECTYKAPTQSEYTSAGVAAKTRDHCTQAMEITYNCQALSRQNQVVTVPGDAWNHPPAKLACF